MNHSLLATKLFVPPQRIKAIERATLGRRLGEGLWQGEGFARKLTLVSAPPGFGKTSLVSGWLAGVPVGKAWLSLDEKDSDATRFLTYLVAAIQTIEPSLGAWVLSALQVPQPPSMETLLIRLVNDLTGYGRHLILVLDDYHAINSPAVDEILALLIDRLPPSVHLVMITREDPGLPLARYRARGQMIELRAQDLRFSNSEVGNFFRLMEIPLSQSDITALETRTEGWVAGLQFAALALQANTEPTAQTAFIASFTGSHRYVLDYLVEEVLSQRSEAAQKFLLATSCLGRICGALCEAVLELPPGMGSQTLEALDRANLFLVPLDDERQWYRYHHLFAELLQRRLAAAPTASCPDPATVHARASLWFDQNDYVLEAFRHAAASGNTMRAEALIADRRMPTHTRGAMMEVIAWLTGLPAGVKDAQPSLWVKSATYSLIAGLTAGVEERLQAAELALRSQADSQKLLWGQISTARATLAVSQYRMEDAKMHALTALELLAGDPSAFHLAALWDLGIAHQNTGNRTEARRIFEEVLAFSRAGGVVFFEILSALGVGELQENDNQLFLAAETYRQVLQLSGDHPQPNICEAYLGLARIHYQWNDLEKAGFYGEQGLVLARQYDRAVDRFVSCEVFLAKIERGRGNLDLAEERLTQAEQTALKFGFLHRLPEIQTAKVLLQLRMGRIPEPDGLPPPLRIRILLARAQPDAAAGLLDSWAGQVQDQADDWLQSLVLRALVLEAKGNHGLALAALEDALKLAQPGGFRRLFTDEGTELLKLVQATHARGRFTEYTARILATFASDTLMKRQDILSEREREVLLHLADGLSNQDIAEKLFLSLHTVKVHIRKIFAKLGAPSRTSAVAKARSLGLLP